MPVVAKRTAAWHAGEDPGRQRRLGRVLQKHRGDRIAATELRLEDRYALARHLDVDERNGQRMAGRNAQLPGQTEVRGRLVFAHFGYRGRPRDGSSRRGCHERAGPAPNSAGIPRAFTAIEPPIPRHSYRERIGLGLSSFSTDS